MPPAGASRVRPVLALGGIALLAMAAWALFRGPGRGPRGAMGDGGGPRTIVLVIVDTLRADHLGCYGGKSAATPVADRLAARGTLFREAYCAAPLTRPSITSLLTGLYPLRHGVHDNVGERLGDEVPTAVERLAAAGYACGAFVSGEPLDATAGLTRGFAAYDDRLAEGRAPPCGGAPYGYAGYAANVTLRERLGERTVAAALEWSRGAGPGSQFLLVHLFDPHAPYAAPAPEGVRYAGSPYAGEVAYADRCVGSLLSGLEAAGRGDALVLLTADHGEGLGEHREDTHGYFLYETTVRVPLLVAGPGVASGRRVEGPVRLVDVAPTLLALARAEPLPATDGGSLAVLLAPDSPSSPSAAGPSDRAAYLESRYCAHRFGWAALEGVRAGAWKLVEAPRPELYEIPADPDEARDRAGEPGAAAALSSARAALAAARPGPGARAARAPIPAAESPYGAFVRSGAAPASGRNPMDSAHLIRLFERGRSEAGAGRHPEALDAFQAVLEEDPRNVAARVWTAHTRRRAGDLLGAERDYRAVLAEGADPGNPEAERGLATCLRRLGRPAEAEELLRRAERARPEDPWPLAGIAGLRVDEGRLEEAQGLLERALRLSPGHPVLSENLESVRRLRTAGDRLPGARPR
ncbi:MAG: sulfatase-like hydrolase/transferase [Planctomycetales bacterium]|nr:sulfatase-like hydrolase/transferase [Planctomycetales bacterium]